MNNYETIRVNSRRSKAKSLWTTPGLVVPVFKRDKRGRVSQVPGAANAIISCAYTVPIELQWVEAIAIDGVPVYTADQTKEYRPLTSPMIGGGRFRFTRSFKEGAMVLRILQILDISVPYGSTPDIRVVFGYKEEPKHGQES